MDSFAFGELRRMLSESHAPVLLVASSPGADALAARSGVRSVTDLLRPFASLTGSVPVRTPSRPLTLTDFSIRLLPAAGFGFTPVDALEGALSGVVSSAPDGPLCVGPALSRLPLLGKGGVTLPAKEPLPALRAWRSELHRSLRCLPQEQRDAPACLLCVASTADASPLSALTELAGALPRPFSPSVGHYDPELPRLFLLLHDVGGGGGVGGTPVCDPAVTAREMRSRFPPQACFALGVNNRPVTDRGAAPVVPDVWKVGAGAGAALTPDDVTNLKSFMGRLITDSLLPSLEARLAALTSVVSANRKGLREKMSSWWKPGASVADRAMSVGTSLLGAALGGDSSPGVGSEDGFSSASTSDALTVVHSASSLDGQTRLLADLCMAIGDYDSAAGYFRSLRVESKPSAAPMWAGACAEGAALATAAASGPSRDVDGLLESAIGLYTRAAGMTVGKDGGGDTAGGRKLATRLATRASLYAADMLVWGAASAATGITSGGAGGLSANAASVTAVMTHLRDASSILRRAAALEGESTLAAALLTEGSAVCHLRPALPPFPALPGVPISHRKAAYLLHCAGGYYANSGHSRHAARCLALALSSYSPVEEGANQGGWVLANEGIRLALAGQLAALGDASAATSVLAQCLSGGGDRLSQAAQRTALTQFLKTWASFAAGKVSAARARAVALAARAGADAPPVDEATVVAAGGKSAELVSIGLPEVVDGSFEVCSWGNGVGAAAAVAAVTADTASRAKIQELCTTVLTKLGVAGQAAPRAGEIVVMNSPASLPLPRPNAGDGLDTMLVEAGCMGAGAAAVLGQPPNRVRSSLWGGSLPSEGPASGGGGGGAGAGAGGGVWGRIEADALRDVRLKQSGRKKRGGGCAPPPLPWTGTGMRGSGRGAPPPSAGCGTPPPRAVRWMP